MTAPRPIGRAATVRGDYRFRLDRWLHHDLWAANEPSIHVIGVNPSTADDKIVAAWGPMAKLPWNLRNRWRHIIDLASECGRELKCWGTAKDGHPRHPLMLSYETPLVPWSPPA